MPLIKLLLACTLLFIPAITFAQLSSISLSGNPGLMTISTATAGSQPNSVTDSSTTYSLVNLLTGGRITGQLNASLPTGVTLQVSMQAPALGGVSQGFVTMTTTAANLVTNIPIISLGVAGMTISYRLSATVAASPVSNATVQVTFTIQ